MLICKKPLRSRGDTYGGFPSLFTSFSSFNSTQYHVATLTFNIPCHMSIPRGTYYVPCRRPNNMATSLGVDFKIRI